jgi:hypothetical protein
MSYQKLKNTAFVIGVDTYDRQSLFERIRLNDIANAFKLFPIGGSRDRGLDGTGAQDAIDYQEIELDGDLLAGFTIRARVQIKTENAGTTITPQIWDVTTAAVLVTTGGSASASLVWASQDLVLTLPPAVRRYKLQFVKSNANFQVWGIGYLEIKAP